MTAVILDKSLEKRLVARRRQLGTDRFDEVWEGIYFMSPAADIEHFAISNDLATVLTIVVKWAGLGEVLPGVNVSDRKRNWKKNFRVPDVSVFLQSNPAEDCNQFWHGGPDFAVEVVSPNDRTRKKIPFYEKVGTTELLVVDRRPWRLTLYRQIKQKLSVIGQSTHDNPLCLTSSVLPLSFQLAGTEDRPTILIQHLSDRRQWTVEARLKRSQ